MEQTLRDQFDKHTGNAAKMMLNLSLYSVNNEKSNSLKQIENCLKDSISSASFIKSDGHAQKRAESMTKEFENKLAFMRKSDVEISRGALVTLFVKCVGKDKEMLDVVKSALSSDNLKMLEESSKFEAKHLNSREHDTNGLSM